MKRTLSRNLGSLPSGKVTLILLTLPEPSGLLNYPRIIILSSCPVDFRRRFLSLLSYQFSTFSPSLALNILQNKNIKQQPQAGEYPHWDSCKCMTQHGWSLELQFAVFPRCSTEENLLERTWYLCFVGFHCLCWLGKGTNLFYSS